MWTWEALCRSKRALYRPERALCRPERTLFRSEKFLCWPETSYVSLRGPSLGPEENLSVWEGLCCSERAPYRSARALNRPKWTQDVILSVCEGLMLHCQGPMSACAEHELTFSVPERTLS